MSGPFMSSLNLIGFYKNFDEVPDDKKTVGTVVLIPDSVTGQPVPYLYDNFEKDNTWIQMYESEDTYNTYNNDYETKLIQCKCNSCGAPIQYRAGDKQVKCEYCDSIYDVSRLRI